MFYSQTSLIISLLATFIPISLWILKRNVSGGGCCILQANAHADEFCKCIAFIYNFAQWLHFIYSLHCFFSVAPPIIVSLVNYRVRSDMQLALMNDSNINAAAWLFIKTTPLFFFYPTATQTKITKLKCCCDVPIKRTQEGSTWEIPRVLPFSVRLLRPAYVHAGLKSKQCPDALGLYSQRGGHDNRLFFTTALPANCE